MKLKFFLPVMALVMLIAGCALAPPAASPPVVAPPPVAVPGAGAKTNAIINGVPAIITATDVSSGIQAAVPVAQAVAPQYAPEIALGGFAAITLLGVLSKILDHKATTTAITTPGTTPPPAP